jgi:hypothetical protein
MINDLMKNIELSQANRSILTPTKNDLFFYFTIITTASIYHCSSIPEGDIMITGKTVF